MLRGRIRDIGVDCVLLENESDIDLHTHCPVSGGLLNYTERNKNGCRDDWASLDRMIPDIGYVKGNVHIISHRTNRLKNNATLQEMEQIVN